MPATLKFTETFWAPNQVISHAAKSTTVNCRCTCPNDESYDVEDENEPCAKYACHFGVISDCKKPSASNFAVKKVICGKEF
jgi:hypothetical protein